MEHEVRIMERAPLLVVSRRLPVRVPEMPGVIAGAYGAIYGFLGSHGVAPDGPPFLVYHSMPVPGEPFDIEICAPVARMVEPPDPWRMRTLPGGTFASVTHVGPYDTIGAAYDFLHAWIPGNGMMAAGPPREVYLSDPTTPPAQVRTVVEFPVERAPAPVG